MQHSMRFEGGFERNYESLKPDATQFQGEDGSLHPMVAWPSTATGLRYGFMEKPGKKFVTVSVGFEDTDVILQHPVRIDEVRHLGGKRFSAEAFTIADGPAGTLFGDIYDSNPEQREALTALRERIRDAIRGQRAD